MTELIWDGKYRETPQGRQKVAPVRIALPFQTIETGNESAQARQRSLELFASGRETEWRNRLIWGDKKYVLLRGRTSPLRWLRLYDTLDALENKRLVGHTRPDGSEYFSGY